MVFFFFICNNVDSIQKRQINQDLLFQSVTFAGLAAHQTLLLTVHFTGDSLTSRWNISIPPEVKTCRILTQPSLQLQQVTLMSTAKPPDGIYIYIFKISSTSSRECNDSEQLKSPNQKQTNTAYLI